jgi:hypothetical protein
MFTDTTSLTIVWSPYGGSDALLLSLLLGLVAAGLVFLGWRMRKEINLPKMGRILGIIVIIIWAFAILTFLKINKDYSKYTGAATNLGPIFPITLLTASCAFGYVAHISRRGGVGSALGNGFLAFVAGPMVFEFPFVLIVIPMVKAPLIPEIIFLTPLFTIIFTTLALLLLSRRIAITKYSVYLLAGMIFVFAVWALEGYSYPTNPVSFILNAVSKVLGFACVAALFSIGESKGLQKLPNEGKQILSKNDKKIP